LEGASEVTWIVRQNILVRNAKRRAGEKGRGKGPVIKSVKGGREPQTDQKKQKVKTRGWKIFSSLFERDLKWEGPQEEREARIKKPCIYGTGHTTSVSLTEGNWSSVMGGQRL